MQQLDSSFILLCVLAIVCYLSKNNTVAIAVLVLLIVKLTPLSIYFPIIEKKGLNWGIMLLTVAVLVPLANGKITFLTIVESFKNWQTIAAILMGIFVSWVGMRGIPLLTTQPMIATGLIIGTLIGVAFFRGIPVGPLIAAGLLTFFIRP